MDKNAFEINSKSSSEDEKLVFERTFSAALREEGDKLEIFEQAQKKSEEVFKKLLEADPKSGEGHQILEEYEKTRNEERESFEEWTKAHAKFFELLNKIKKYFPE